MAFADFGGNRQYITVGNLSENPKAFLFLMDYANQNRVKLWGMEGLTGAIENTRHLYKKGGKATECGLIRCIFPYRPTTFDPAWLTSTAVALARGIYADRAFDRMPILADALQDTGCNNAEVLRHCRTGESHARGCWAESSPVLGA